MKKLLRDAFDYLYLKHYRMPGPVELKQLGTQDRIHYGCGANYLSGWLNVDMVPRIRVPSAHRSSYLQMSLVHRHPFADNVFAYGYAEDVLEHLTQDTSLLFLAEAFRTLKPGGTLRLSFPGLRQVLTRHYRCSDFAGADRGRQEAFTPFGHRHFYSEESIALVARHLGFRSVELAAFRESRCPALAGLESRKEQIDLNVNVELTK